MSRPAMSGTDPGRGRFGRAARDGSRRNKVGHKPPVFRIGLRFLAVTSSPDALLCSDRMQATPRQSFQPAAAGALLASVTGAGVGAGALLGWGFGNVGIGVLAGALAGVPAGIYAVYRRYRGFFT